MLYHLIRHILRHWKHYRSLSFKTLGCGNHWEPDKAMLYIHCNRCNSTGCIPVKRVTPNLWCKREKMEDMESKSVHLREDPDTTPPLTR